MTTKIGNTIIVYSEKLKEEVEFELVDENLSIENYECIGCSNADYGN